MILTFWDNGKYVKVNFQCFPPWLLIYQFLVSTVALEQAFSASEHVIGNMRTMLVEETVETCMCLRDWFQAKSRTQHLIEEDEIEDELSTLQIS